MAKRKDIRFVVLNIKLQTENAVTTESYKRLFDEAFKQKAMGKIYGETYGIISQLFQPQDAPYVYGVFCSFVKVGDKAFNLSELKIVDFQISKDLLPNPREVDFIFYPELHRLAIKANSKISINSVKKMLDDIFSQVLEDDTKAEISIEQSSDVFERITSAKHISSLHIVVSPSNADLNQASTEFFDNQLKAMQAEKMVSDIRPNASGKLIFEDSTVLQGMLGMAQSNGYVEATIINENEKKELIKTNDHPRNFFITGVSPEEAKISLYNKLKETFRK